ncbi:MAG TPA: hypothetical protein ENH82_05220 [bacterium]|nr:hypothetical protein [bacterium]
MNIYQKLIEIRKQVVCLKKDGDNKHFNFKYVSSSKTLIALRKKMDDLGVLLVPKIVGHTITQGEKRILTELDIEYTWLNAEKPEETLVCPFYAQGIDSNELGVGKALTYGEKYFLLKFFNIATDKDDPDQGEKNRGGKSQDSPKNRDSKTEYSNKKATEKQMNCFIK